MFESKMLNCWSQKGKQKKNEIREIDFVNPRFKFKKNIKCFYYFDWILAKFSGNFGTRPGNFGTRPEILFRPGNFGTRPENFGTRPGN